MRNTVIATLAAASLLLAPRRHARGVWFGYCHGDQLFHLRGKPCGVE